MIGARHLQIARTSRRGINRPSNGGSAGMRDNGENLGCQTSARLDRLAVAKSGISIAVGVPAGLAPCVAEGSGALGRHQRRSIVSGTDMKPNVELRGPEAALSPKAPSRTQG